MKERQAKENALTQLQLAAEKELENSDLLQQLNMLQVCSHGAMLTMCFFFFLPPRKKQFGAIEQLL